MLFRSLQEGLRYLYERYGRTADVIRAMIDELLNLPRANSQAIMVRNGERYLQMKKLLLQHNFDANLDRQTRDRLLPKLLNDENKNIYVRELLSKEREWQQEIRRQNNLTQDESNNFDLEGAEKIEAAMEEKRKKHFDLFHSDCLESAKRLLQMNNIESAPSHKDKRPRNMNASHKAQPHNMGPTKRSKQLCYNSEGVRCRFCEGSHIISSATDCKKFLSCTPRERKKLLLEHFKDQICCRCLKVADHKRKGTCKVTCSKCGQEIGRAHV